MSDGGVGGGIIRGEKGKYKSMFLEEKLLKTFYVSIDFFFRSSEFFVPPSQLL